MKRWMINGWIALLLFSCIRENTCPCMGPHTVIFRMEDVPYAFEGDEVAEYRPYSVFTDRLDIMAFRGQKPDTTVTYGYEFCKTHTFIPWELLPGSYDFIFVANIFDHKAVSWDYEEDRLRLYFHIVDGQEPPVYLAAERSRNVYASSVLPVELRMLVSRLEVKVVNPPAWVEGFNFRVRRVAREMSLEGRLKDTVSITKYISFQPSETGEYVVGMNTFPTFPGQPALVDIQLRGNGRQAQLIVDDSRIHFVAGKIVRVSIEFESENSVSVSVEIDGVWEIIDEGKIII